LVANLAFVSVARSASRKRWRSLYVDADLRVGVGSQLQWRRMFVGIIDVLLDLELVPPALHHATQSCDVDTQRDAYLNFWLVMRTGAAGT
jgi:hypothetical protein